MVRKSVMEDIIMEDIEMDDDFFEKEFVLDDNNNDPVPAAPAIVIIMHHDYIDPVMIRRFRHLIGYATGINLQSRDTTIGLPQDSILSPILFNLYIVLSHTVLPDTVNILYYADDIAIYCLDSRLESIRDQLNNALESLYQFFMNLGLVISPSKSSYLRVGNGNIQFSPATRFLGVVLDSELNLKAHINHVRNRIMPRINILKVITGIKWGAHPTNLLNIYKGFIRPLLDWGCQSFNPLDENLYLNISRLQYASLRTVSGLMITTRTNVLLDINGEFPLDSRWTPGPGVPRYCYA
ncbi:uncharacterized protein LOC115244706 [Formica exsecta]|uniref:uncharacterized protein LOC115244706 n=1 Tax=Formica exsecta TaxID=72781 RepID=UPI001144DC31|nr:uncharacterized protein LOC115244706 [Formica exsecta]